MSNPIIKFYSGYRPENNEYPYTFSSIINATDNDLEFTHDFIQWLFPLSEPSEFNKNAPLLTTEDIDTFINTRNLQTRVKVAVRRFLNFLGLTETKMGYIELYDVRYYNDRILFRGHNHLRISRMLKFLMLIEMVELANNIRNVLPPNKFWDEAVNKDLAYNG